MVNITFISSHQSELSDWRRRNDYLNFYQFSSEKLKPAILFAILVLGFIVFHQKDEKQTEKAPSYVNFHRFSSKMKKIRTESSW